MFRLKELGVVKVNATYSRTLKNNQVVDFYQKAGFKIANKTDDRIDYVISMNEYTPMNINYIKVKYEREN